MASTKDTALVADIGGTNTRVALAQGKALLQKSIKRFRNAEFPDLETILKSYLNDQNASVSAVCIAVAGPVQDDRASLTNFDWDIESSLIKTATGADQVAILNDLQAQGHALDQLEPDHLHQIAPGRPKQAAPKLVVGVGTGFNAALVLQTEHDNVALASECGHAQLPVTTADHLDLYKFIETKRGFCCIEDAVSGRGLVNIYRWMAKDTAQANVTAKEIVEACDAGMNTPEAQAGKLFCRLLGHVAGDLALTQLPHGGIYFVGGVARAFTPHLMQFGFYEAFTDKGRFSDFMCHFPLFVVHDDFAALNGAASFLTKQ